MKREMHDNSLLAYHEGREDVFGPRELAVIGALKRLGRATDRQVMAHLGFTDPNAVRPRISALVDAGVVREIGDVEDATTHKRVRLVTLAPHPRSAQTEFALR